jgi:hypothetical protein
MEKPTTRKLPDWILNPKEKMEELDDDDDDETVMLENTRMAIEFLEKHEWKKDWGEWDSAEEDVEFELSQSSLIDSMTEGDVMEIIIKVKGEAYTSSYPFYDDREGLANDLRSCLCIYCKQCGIPYFE